MKTFTLFLNISISVAELMPRRGLYFSISVKYIYINVNFSANLHALLISLAYKSSQYCDMVPHSKCAYPVIRYLHNQAASVVNHSWGQCTHPFL